MRKISVFFPKVSIEQFIVRSIFPLKIESSKKNGTGNHYQKDKMNSIFIFREPSRGKKLHKQTKSVQFF